MEKLKPLTIAKLSGIYGVELKSRLRENDDRLRAALVAARISTWELNPVTCQLEWSDNLEQVLGFPLYHNLDKPLNLIHPDDLTLALDAINKAVKTGGDYQSEYRIINPSNGEICWFHSQGKVIRHADGSPRIAGITQNINERKLLTEENRITLQHTNDELHQSLEKCRTLFNTIDEGYCVVDVLFDENKNPVDFCFLEVNPVFEMQMKLQDAVGKRVLEIVPAHDGYWIEIFGNVIKTNRPLRSERYSARLNKSFEFYALRIGKPDDHQVAAIFRDITAIKQVESNNRFLVSIAEDLARLTLVEEILYSAGEKIGAYLNLSLCLFIEISQSGGNTVSINHWLSQEVRNNAGSYGISDFITDEYLRVAGARDILVMGDTRADGANEKDRSALNMGAFISAPLIRNGDVLFTLNVYSAKVREWRTDEIELTRDLAGLIWHRIEKARAEQAVRVSERHLQKALSIETVGVAFFNGKGLFTDVNGSFARMSGYSRGELSSGSFGWESMTPQEWMARSWQSISELRTTGQTTPYEKEYIRKDGSRFWVLSTASQISEYEFVEYIIDITGRKQAEEQIRLTNTWMTIGVEAANAGWVHWDFTTGETKWSESGKRIMGINSERSNSEDWLARIYPEDQPKVLAHIAEAIASKINFNMEYRIVRPDGEIRWLLGIAKILYNENNAPYQSTGFIMDISERKRTEEALRESEEHYRAMISQSTAGIAETDLSGKFISANDRYCEIVGYTREELLSGMRYEDILHPDENLDPFRRCVREGIPFTIERRCARKDKSIVWISNNVSLLYNTENKPRNCIFVTFDISSRKELERQKEEFIGIASHELKTPVTSIKAYAEVLQEMFLEAGDTTSANLMSKLDGQVDRLTSLIRELLDVTKITGGQLQLQGEVFDIHELIDERVEELKRLTSNHEFVINPGQLEHLHADRERIGEVLTNLIGNAIKYSPNGGKVIISSEPLENGVKVNIQDYGIGIDPDMQKKIFGRFFRVNDAKISTYPGLGLGLYISSEIIKRHHGTIHVESRKGHGSTFSFTIPYNGIRDQQTEVCST